VTDKQRDALIAGRNYFSSKNQPANRGRKPSKLKKWIKEQNVSNEDFIALFKNLIAVHTLEELEVMVNEENKKKLPVIMALCISAFLHDMKTGTLTATNSILDRIMGKPTQQITFGANSGLELPDDPEERAALAERLRKDIEIRGMRNVTEVEEEHKEEEK
jgi:hypothetical protein